MGSPELLSETLTSLTLLDSSLFPAVWGSSSEPVNRVMTVWAGPDTPTPHLSCLVGFTSIEITQLWRISCSNATNHRLGIAKIDRKKLKWPKEKSEIVFG